LDSPANRRRIRICLAASAGGHLLQLLKLEPAWRDARKFFLTTGDVVAAELRERYDSPVYLAVECNRYQPLRLLRSSLRSLAAMLREKPDVILSTGAASGCIACLLGKLAGAKVVWVDSIANVDRLSLSGRIVLLFADLFVVQWPHLATGGRGIEFHGQLI